MEDAGPGEELRVFSSPFTVRCVSGTRGGGFMEPWEEAVVPLVVVIAAAIGLGGAQ